MIGISSDIFATIGGGTNSLSATAANRPTGSGGYAITEAAAAAAVAHSGVGGNGADGTSAASASASASAYRLHLNPLKANGTTDLDQQLFEVGNNKVIRTKAMAEYCYWHRIFVNINTLAISADISLFIGLFLC